MRLIWILVVLFAACERDTEKKEDKPALPTATGNIELAPSSPELADTLLATEAELIRSRALVQMTNERNRLDGALTSEAIRTARRGGSMTIDVSVSDADGGRARSLCDALMQSYVEFRYGRAVERIVGRQARVSEILGEERGSARLAELDKKRRTLESDVRKPYRCKLGAASSRAAGPARSMAATGSIAFEPRAPAAATSLLASEVEVVRSEAVVRMANDRVRTVAELNGTELARAAIHVARRARSMLVDISVNDPDPRRAAALCNVLISSYIEHRMLGAVATAKERQRVVAGELQRDPDDEALRHEAEQLELAIRAPEADVHVVDTCIAPAATEPSSGATK